MISRKCVLAVLLSLIPAAWAVADEGTMSTNNQVMVVPAPGPVVIDGKTDDWDLSAGVWSYNNPTLVDKYSLWTHMMWDDKGVYMVARYSDLSPMQNAARGKDFQQSWRADAYQARVIFDDRSPDEHQMHVNMFYSTPEQTPYMIVKHGGFKATPPYDGTGPDRPDLLERRFHSSRHHLHRDPQPAPQRRGHFRHDRGLRPARAAASPRPVLALGPERARVSAEERLVSQQQASLAEQPAWPEQALPEGQPLSPERQQVQQRRRHLRSTTPDLALLFGRA